MMCQRDRSFGRKFRCVNCFRPFRHQKNEPTHSTPARTSRNTPPKTKILAHPGCQSTADDYLRHTTTRMHEKLDPGNQKTAGFVLRLAYPALPDTTLPSLPRLPSKPSKLEFNAADRRGFVITCGVKTVSVENTTRQRPAVGVPLPRNQGPGCEPTICTDYRHHWTRR